MNSAESWKELAHDAYLVNQELRERVAFLESRVNEEKRKRLIAEIDLKFANKKVDELRRKLDGDAA